MGTIDATGGLKILTRPKSLPLADDLKTLFGAGALGRLSDRELLAHFVRREDRAASEAAFSALVARHGPMVLAVCRRMLRDEHFAADAFQAVFLILARKACSVRVDDTLGRWLCGVSVRVAGRARAIAGSERGRVKCLGEFDQACHADPSLSCERGELRAVVDEEIARLPVRYRLPIVLCYLEGMTQEQAARRLRCPLGTVESRLQRARERLRTRLIRRGLAPAAGAVAATFAANTRADVPPEVAVETASAAVRLASGEVLAEVVSAGAAALVRQTMRSMLMTKGWLAGLVLAMVGVSANWTGILTAAGDDKPTDPASGAGTPRGNVGQESPVVSLADRLKQQSMSAASWRRLWPVSVRLPMKPWRGSTICTTWCRTCRLPRSSELISTANG
jgi:RNA polymerase sigma factor (sigma-70 family)